MPDDVTLVGLDFGTTTSSAVVATTSLIRSAGTGRSEFGPIRERYRSETIFTSLDEHDRLDERKMEQILDAWLNAGNVRAAEVFGGGAMLTGLTAQKENAAVLVRMIRERLGDALVATADDPRLESWLAFMGNCASLSRARPSEMVLNLDIGGGTTNFAVGINGQVWRTGSYFVGARHVQVVPGSYQIIRLSRFARALFEQLGIRRGVGDHLSQDEVDAVVGYYASLLEAALSGQPEFLGQPAAQMHVQVPFQPPPAGDNVAITFSGGVGELIYEHSAGKPWPSQTQFGDLGIDLGRKIVDSPIFSRQVLNARPAAAGRATVYGLLRYSTEISGSTLWLPRQDVLPLTDMPIFGRLDSRATFDRIRALVELVQHSTRGGCVQVLLGTHDASAVRGLGEKIRTVLRDASFPPDLPLVFLMQENLGKSLGNYITAWGAAPLNVIVVDEAPLRDAQYAHLGTPRGHAVPVSFCGLNEPGDGL
jgi:ethanolamine utilization protein EutA